MDMVKKYFEAYVQWLAVALGAGFLGWMIYSYIVIKPVASTVGSNAAVSPSEVDTTVWNGPGQTLETQMKSNAPAPQMGVQEDLPAKVVADRDKVSTAVAIDLSTPYTPLPVPQDAGPGNVGPGGAKMAKITVLPKAPPLLSLTVSGGHSNVQPPPPAAPPAGGVAPTNPTAVDKNWRTVEATFPVAELAKSFKAVGIEPGSPFSSTCILRVVLMRQERNIDGTWPADNAVTEIAPLDLNPLQPLPPIDASAAVQKDYVENYAEKNQVSICQPPFYQVLEGDKWYEPGTPNPNDAVEVDDGYDPKNPGAFTGDVDKLLPKEKLAVKEARDEQAKREALKQRSQQNRSNSPNPRSLPPGFPGGGGGPGGPGSPAAPSFQQQDPDRPAYGGRGYPPFGRPPGFDRPPMFGGPPPMPGQQQPTGPNNLPGGSFDPSTQLSFKVWAHDVTVQAGKTYRYKMKYIISNPVARTNGLCNPQNLADIFYIESAPSDWSQPQSVEADTNFYATDFKSGVHFDVFKWKDGVWQMQGVNVNPGDMVGTVETSKITGATTDFTTGWTLVDVREDPTNSDNKTLVLVSNNGTILRKELLTDEDSSEYRKLYHQVMDSKDKTASAGSPANPTP